MSSDGENETEQDIGTQRDDFDMESNEAQTLISDFVQYVITISQKKIPIKKANISKECLQNRARKFNKIYEVANENLEKYFGMKLVEVPNKTSHQYILINTLNDIGIPYHEISHEDHLINGILLPVLAVIFMLKGETKEETIYNFLKTLGLDVESNKKLSPLNYTLKQLLTNVWVKQLYLEYYKIGENEDKYYAFNWGFRSECEINKNALLNFVSSIYDAHVAPETWHEQFQVANSRIDDQEAID